MNGPIKEKVMLFWSGGKDSALALHYIEQDPNLEIVGLITTFNQKSNTVPFHGIPDSLVIQQAKMLKLPLQRIFLPDQCSNEEYISRLRELLLLFAKCGVKTVAFGDTHFSDIKEFKEKILAPLEFRGLFPLWGKNSKSIAEEFLSLGYKALVTSIETSKLDKSFLNCEYNDDFLKRLPERGPDSAFHTFVIYGPGFKSRVAFSKSIAIADGPYLVSLLKEP